MKFCLLITIIIALNIGCRQQSIAPDSEAYSYGLNNLLNNSSDSSNINVALSNALEKVQKIIEKDSFKLNYNFQLDKKYDAVNVDITLGNIFKNDQKYLLLRRQDPYDTYLDLYKVNGKALEKVISRFDEGMTYLNHYIFDVNGDKQLDFIVNWSPPSGCCPRDIHNVYLYNGIVGEFSQDYEFINPTFYPTEKLIRGYGYGYPLEVPLYKYKWNGEKVDTIEFIYQDTLIIGQYIKTKKKHNYPTYKDGVVLKKLPKEYLSITGYEYF